MKKRIIFHIDVNNAFLSWTAVDMLRNGSKIDIRNIPSVIGGDEEARRGIVTAKSPVAKKMGVKTADTLYSARKKCPNLKVYKGDMELYKKESIKLYEYYLTITPTVERFSIDECYLDLTNTTYLYKDIMELAKNIQKYINETFGITVNIGIANNKLCAKMASDFEKPNKIHTLFDNEVKDKMWPLPVGELYMVGKKSALKLNELGIKTIGDLANSDLTMLTKYFKSMGLSMHNSANGIDDTPVQKKESKHKSISTTETLYKDIDDPVILKKILFRQVEEIGIDLRKQGFYCNTIGVIFRTKDFVDYSQQKTIDNSTNINEEIYRVVTEVFDKGYKKEPLRLIGVRLSNFTKENIQQVTLFDKPKDEKSEKVQKVLDDIKNKFGNEIIKPASLIDNDKNKNLK